MLPYTHKLRYRRLASGLEGSPRDSRPEVGLAGGGLLVGQAPKVLPLLQKPLKPSCGGQPSFRRKELQSPGPGSQGAQGPYGAEPGS